MLKRGREEDHGAASSDVATSEGGTQKAKDQLLHDLFACSPQQTSTDGSVAAAAAARPAVGATMGPPNGGQARGPNTQSELQFRAVHRLTRCPPPLLPAPSPPPPPTPPTPPPTPMASSAAVDPPPAPPSCAKRTTPTHLRTRLTPATPSLGVRMLMLSSQERHEQHLQREQANPNPNPNPNPDPSPRPRPSPDTNPDPDQARPLTPHTSCRS